MDAVREVCVGLDTLDKKGGAEMASMKVSSGGPYEQVYGYSRAVRVGQHVYVSGTTATGPDGKVVAPGDAYAQTKQALHIIETALNQCGASLREVVRTRTFTTDITNTWRQIAKAHAEAFGGVRPASTLVEIKALIDPAMLIEIEVDAVIPA